MADSKQTQGDPTCAICFGDIRDPVKLPCQHTYCRECIRTHAEKSKPTDTSDRSDSSTIPKQHWPISCPLCRKEASLGTDGVDGLPKNMHLAGMVDKSGKAEGNDQELCVTHNMPLIMYCEACHKLICIECLREHGGHPMRDKDTVYRKLKAPFVRKTEGCKELKDKMMGLVSELKGFVEDIEGNENRHRAEVESAYSQGLEVLNAWRKDALGLIENRHSILTSQTQTAIAELAAKLPDVEQMIQDARDLPTSLTEAFLTMSRNLTSRMEDVMPEVTDFMKSQRENKRKIEKTLKLDPALPIHLNVKLNTVTGMTDGSVRPEVTDFMENQRENKMKIEGTLKLDPALAFHLIVKLNTDGSDRPEVTDFMKSLGGTKVVSVPEMKFIKTDDTRLVIEDDGCTVKLGDFGAICCTAWTDICIQRGCHFWELQISLMPCSRQPNIVTWICTAGLMHANCSLRFDTAGVKCWWIGVAKRKDECRLESLCGQVKEPYGKLVPYQNKYTLGFCVHCDTRRLTVIDCVRNAVLLTMDNVDVSKPLVPAVTFYGKYIQAASARLVTADSASPPTVLRSILKSLSEDY